MFCVLCGSYLQADACFAADIRTWAFEATIVSNDDPLFTAADVRLGDPIRGTFSFDLSLAADPNSRPDNALYIYPPAFQGIQLAIENPRRETRLEYFPLIGRDEYWMDVWTSDADVNADDESGMTLYQVVVPPDPAWFDFIYMQFVRPGLVTNLSVPTEIKLDDWPLAYFYLWADQASDVDGIIAEIHTLTPVIPGDFNSDVTVDAQDYASWRSAYGLTGFSNADANRNGHVETADYVIWRNNNVAMSISASIDAVPEPASVQLAISVLLIVGLAHNMRRKRRFEYVEMGASRIISTTPLTNSHVSVFPQV